jgi:hypothetical protein
MDKKDEIRRLCISITFIADHDGDIYVTLTNAFNKFIREYNDGNWSDEMNSGGDGYVLHADQFYPELEINELREK